MVHESGAREWCTRVVHESSARDYVSGAREYVSGAREYVSGAQEYVSVWVVHEKNFSELGMGPPEKTLVDWSWVLQSKL